MYIDIKRLLAGCGLAWLAGCGPKADNADWVVGEFSAGRINATVNGVTRYRFFEDGRVQIEAESSCEGEPRIWRMQWSARDADSVSFEPSPSEEPHTDATLFDDLTLRREGDCGPYRREARRRSDGSLATIGELRRGSLCTQRQIPCGPPGGQCDECMLVWCDEEPAPCEEAN